MSWDVSTTPVDVTGHKPTASLIIDSTKVDADKLAAFEAILYGSDGTPGSASELMLPGEVMTHFGVSGGPTEVTVTAVQIGGVTETTDSTGISLTFDENVVGLLASHITLTDGTGSATKGALTGSGKNWTLAITDPVEGDLTVKISGLTGYIFADEEVDVYAAL